MLQGHGDDMYKYGDVRANFSSNIFGHADHAALKQFLQGRLDVIDHYPEPEARSLEAIIARKHGIDNDCVLATSGATEAIYMAAQMLAAMGCRHFRTLPPTFSEYEDACRLFGMTPAANGVLWLCNPNNPTGEVVQLGDESDVWHFEQNFSNLIIIDQSYEDYTLLPVMTPAEAVRRGTVIQIHSLTKTFAVPGLRIGYVVASPPVIERLRAFLLPWSINALAIEAGKWLLENNARAVPDLEAHLAETQRLRTKLNGLAGVSVLPTDCCFMLAELSCGTAAQLKDYLAGNHGLLIRDASNFRGLSPRHFRVSTQLPCENDWLVEGIREFLEAGI